MDFVGVDGCKAGWLAIALTPEGPASHLVAASVGEVAARYPHALILADVPIGLRDSGPSERLCDVEARSVLGPRASSVFPAPCRPALYKEENEAASAENRRLTGRRLSKQSWAITPKIRQVEEYLRDHSREGPVVREIHPEVCFWGLAGRPMEHAKAQDEGFNERLEVLSCHHPEARALNEQLTRRYSTAMLSRDDVLDALAGAVTAFLGAERLQTLPEEPEVDSRGLRMEMVYVRT